MKKLILVLLLLFATPVAGAGQVDFDKANAKKFAECKDCSASGRETRTFLRRAIFQLGQFKSDNAVQVEAFTLSLRRLIENMATLENNLKVIVNGDMAALEARMTALENNQRVIRDDQKAGIVANVEFKNQMLDYFKPINAHLREHKKD